MSISSWERHRRDIDIKGRLEGRPHLEAMSTSLYFVPERIMEYDPAYFLVRNHKKASYEVHCLGNRGDSYAFTVPWGDDLDARTVQKVANVDVKRRGFQAIMREIDARNAKVEADNERQWDDDMNQIARESYKAFRHTALYE